MRLGLDVRVADPETSGQQRYLWRLGAWAASVGHEVHFLTVRHQPADVATPANTRLHRLGGLSRAGLRRAVAELELDVLLLNPERSRHYHGLRANVLRAAYGTDHYRQKLRSVRSPLSRAVRRVVREAPWTRLERNRERAFYEPFGSPPEVIAQSSYMRDQILATYAVPEEHVHVVPNGVDVHEFNPRARAGLRAEARARWGIDDDAVCFVMLAHNYRLKGLGETLRALEAMGDDGPPVHLLVAGKGTGELQRRAAARLVRSTCPGGRVTLAGAVHPALDALAAGDALVHLSWHDSFGFAVLEAMAVGLPVVTSPFTGAAEHVDPAGAGPDRVGRSSEVTPGVAGSVVSPGDTVGVARALRRMLDGDVRAALGRSAAATAKALDEPASFTRALAVMRIAAGRQSAGLSS